MLPKKLRGILEKRQSLSPKSINVTRRVKLKCQFCEVNLTHVFQKPCKLHRKNLRRYSPDCPYVTGGDSGGQLSRIPCFWLDLIFLQPSLSRYAIWCGDSPPRANYTSSMRLFIHTGRCCHLRVLLFPCVCDLSSELSALKLLCR